MAIRDVKHRYPETARIFEEFGFRSICDDCSIETVARRQGLSALDVIDALNRSIAATGGGE
jgi:hypothetical protein